MKKIFIFTICIVLALFVSASSSVSENSEQPVNKVLVLNSYESQSELDTMVITGVLGTVKLNSDVVFNGSYSAEVRVIYDPFKTGQPTIYQATKLEKRGEDYSDFTRVSTVALQVYNAQSDVKRIGIQLVYSSGTSNPSFYDLAPDSWTLIKHNVAREYIPKGEDNKLTVEGVHFLFDRPANADDIFYIDDVSLYQTNLPVLEVEQTLTSEGNVDEICSFDNQWQFEKLETECSGDESLVPEIIWTREKTSKAGGAAVRLNTTPAVDYSKWPSLNIPSALTSMVDWAKYDDNDLFCFDVYAPTESGLCAFSLAMYSSSYRYFYKQFYIPAGQWVTITIPVGEINDSPEYTVEYNFTRTRTIKFAYIEHPGEAKTLFIDEVRMIINE